ncbi:MAG: YbaN family protein [Coriobacteriales bacterium]|jgi:uncharacterized membrane protein YbaN (DUF454 family)|nr:YbaN family protein [Coriobacteriales bacterium]
MRNVETTASKLATIKRGLFAAAGFIFFGLGAIGAFLPILPTTPFLLLAVTCFSRSSARFDAWIKGTRLYKRHLESFVRDRSMTLKTKVSLCAFASAMLLLAFALADNLHVRILIAALILFKYWYFIFRVRTISPAEAVAKEAHKKQSTSP